MAEKMIEILSDEEKTRGITNGDKDKAMKAVYEVVVGEGVGKGMEGERFLPLGRDMTERIRGVRESLGHALEVWGSVTDNVHIDK